MTEVCGYKDSNGQFWDTKEEAKLSDLEIELNLVRFNTAHWFLNTDFLQERLVPSDGTNPDTKRKDVVWRTAAGRSGEFKVEDFYNHLLNYPNELIDYARKVSSIKKQMSLLRKLEEKKPWWKFW